MFSSRAAKVQDTVFWLGSAWRVIQVLRLDRLEIELVENPTIRWLCLRQHLRWNSKGNAWILGTEMTPLRRDG